MQGRRREDRRGRASFTTDYEAFGMVDHLVLNEAEITLPRFLEDLRNGVAGHLYTTDQWSDIGPDTHPALGACQYEALCLDQYPVFPGLPLQLRVLRHYPAVRPHAAHKREGPGHQGARERLRVRVQGPGLLC